MTQAKPRLVVLTDIGGDPDDQQSMVRLMTFANEFDVEGLIAGSTNTKEDPTPRTRCDLIEEIVDAYGQVADNLRLHDPAYPDAADLAATIRPGNPARRAIGDGCDTEGSQLLVEVIGRPDPRPVNVAIWGGQTDLAQALWRIRADRGEDGLARAARKLRIYDINDQDKLHARIMSEYPGLFYILSTSRPGTDMRLAAYRGMYLGGREDLTSRAWLDEHVLTGHGPLGPLYPTKTWTAPNPRSTLKEGDTPSYLYFVPNGLGDPAHPEWGGWGGRFALAPDGTYYDAADTVAGIYGYRPTGWRWRDAVQRTFAARMDWCVQPPTGANHPPVVALNGDTTRNVVEVHADPGSRLTLTAIGTTNPDGGKLFYDWWHYPEAGTYPGHVGIESFIDGEAEITIPELAGGTTIHIICEATNTGDPPLTTYRRAVITVES